jgi:hypothetical protein
MDFQKKNEEIELIVEISGQDEPLFQYRCEYSKLIKRIYKSLKDLEANPAWREPDAIEKVWSWEFPSELLQTLKLKLKYI